MITVFEIGDIKEKAKQWGMYYRGNGLGASSLKVSGGVQPSITEEEAVMFMVGVYKLKNRNMKNNETVKEQVLRELPSMLIEEHYLKGIPLNKIYERRGLNSSTGRKYYEFGMAVLEGWCLTYYSSSHHPSLNDYYADLLIELKK